MSLAALAIATRDTLRSSLTDFYGEPGGYGVGDDALDAKRNANCRVMPNDFPAPNCGQEFISIYGGGHRPRDVWDTVATDEQFSLVIAVTRRSSFVPRDHRGETIYIISDEFTADWKSVEERCREIVGLIDKNYALLYAANQLLTAHSGFSEPFVWVGTDPAPIEVGAEHFNAYHTAVDSGSGLPGIPEADDVYGMMMKVRFDEAIRFQRQAYYDRV